RYFFENSGFGVLLEDLAFADLELAESFAANFEAFFFSDEVGSFNQGRKLYERFRRSRNLTDAVLVDGEDVILGSESDGAVLFDGVGNRAVDSVLSNYRVF